MQMKCPNCGKEITTQGKRFCSGCGAALPETAEPRKAPEEFFGNAQPVAGNGKAGKRATRAPWLVFAACLILAAAVGAGYFAHNYYLAKAVNRNAAELLALKNENKSLKEQILNLEDSLIQLDSYTEFAMRQSGQRRMMYENSRKAETEHYAIEYIGGDFDTAIADDVDMLYETLAGVFKAEFGFKRFTNEKKIQLRVFKTETGFYDYRKASGDEGLAGGVYLSDWDEIAMYKGDLPDYYLDKTLVHETTHHLILTHIFNPPLWLNEGLAEYFENSLMEDYSFVYGKPDAQSLIDLKATVKQGGLIPFNEFINISHDDFTNINLRQGRELYIGYAQSWVMVSLFLHSTDENKTTFKNYVKYLLGGGDMSIGTYMGPEKLKLLEEDWNGFIKSL